MGASDGLLFDEPIVAQPTPLPVAVAQRPLAPFNESEEYRHECEVRFVLALGPDRAKEFCAGVEKKRGRTAAVRLWRDARALAKKKPETNNDHA